MASEDGWVGIADVATHLRVARDSIYRWVRTKDFPSHLVGRLLRFRLSEMDEWVRTNGERGPESYSAAMVTSARREDA